MGQICWQTFLAATKDMKKNNADIDKHMSNVKMPRAALFGAVVVATMAAQQQKSVSLTRSDVCCARCFGAVASATCWVCGLPTCTTCMAFEELGCDTCCDIRVTDKINKSRSVSAFVCSSSFI